MDHYAGDLGQYKVLLIGADSYLILKVKHKKKCKNEVRTMEEKFFVSRVEK